MGQPHSCQSVQTSQISMDVGTDCTVFSRNTGVIQYFKPSNAVEHSSRLKEEKTYHVNRHRAFDTIWYLPKMKNLKPGIAESAPNPQQMPC